MLLSKVFKLLWIINITTKWDIMAQNYSDSEDSNIEFTGFNSEDIVNENDFYVPDSEPDPDISVSTVHSSDISKLVEESGEHGNETNDVDQQAEWTQNFGGGTVLMLLNKQVAHCYLMALMLPQHHHLSILSFCSNQESSTR